MQTLYGSVLRFHHCFYLTNGFTTMPPTLRSPDGTICDFSLVSIGAASRLA
jgi:hypothetical protein